MTSVGTARRSGRRQGKYNVWNMPRELPPMLTTPIRRFLFLELLLSICAAGVIIPQGPAIAQSAKPTEYDVEAAYLCQFPKFAQWPAPASRTGKTFPICVIGQNPFGRALEDDARGHQVQGLPLEVKMIASAREAGDCRILFIGGSSESDEAARILAAVRGAPVLTVSEMPEFTSRGGIIQFVLIDSRVRFRINLGNAERAGITMSSQLLRVAAGVERHREPRN